MGRQIIFLVDINIVGSTSYKVEEFLMNANHLGLARPQASVYGIHMTMSPTSKETNHFGSLLSDTGRCANFFTSID